MKFSFNARKFKYGSISTVFVALFVAVIVLVNILAGFLTERFSLKIDMTESGMFSLSEETRDALRSVEDNITIYILATRASMEKNTIMNNTLELISEYNAKSGGKIKYEFIDPNKNPAFFDKYSKARTAKARALVITSPKRYTVVESDEFAYYMGETNRNKVYYQGEELLTSSILYVTSSEVSRAGFITGHGETNPAILNEIFTGNNFDPVDIDLLDGDIPDEFDNLVISAPMTDFSAQEISRLDSYLKSPDNNLYVLWSMDTPSLPVFERFLAEWGIEFLPQVICDESSAYTSPINVVPELTSSDVVDKEGQGQMMIVSPRTRPINILWQENSYNRVIDLLRTGKKSYGKLISADNPISTLSRQSGDERGPFTVGAICERLITSETAGGVSRIIAFGSDGIASENVANISRAFNMRMLTEVVSYSNPNTRTMHIMPKVEPSYDLNITQAQTKSLFVILIFIIPLAILSAGVFVFLRRRNK